MPTRTGARHARARREQLNMLAPKLAAAHAAFERGAYAEAARLYDTLASMLTDVGHLAEALRARGAAYTARQRADQEV